ncbi:MAG: hypothetical protein GF313_17310 [Caldithrix sp.]|nr:hypothetical protein [Caldithrix sp.]
MKRLILFVIMIAMGQMIYSCSRATQSDEELSVNFADSQLQAQVEDLQEKIDDNPNNQEYRRQLATLLHENDRGLQAIKVLENGFAEDPNNIESKYLYGQIALDLGDRVKGYKAYKEVLLSSRGNDYLDRIAPEFVDAFDIQTVVNTEANEAFGNFSPDGNTIIYQSDENGKWDIFTYDLAAGTQSPVITSDAHDEHPAFSNDGSYIVYTSTKDDHRDVSYNQKLREIYRYDIEADQYLNMTTNGSNDWRPRYDNTGKYIVFVSERNDLREVNFLQKKGSIFYMENDGRFQLEVTSHDYNDGNPVIMPGSTEEEGIIYFDSDRNGSYDIFRTDFKGEDLKQITFNPDWDDVGPDINTFADKIVFYSNRNGNYELYLMNMDGSSQQKITSNPAKDLNPIFSPDGKKVLFHSDRNGNFDLYMLDLTSQQRDYTLSEVISKIDRSLNEVQ